MGNRNGTMPDVTTTQPLVVKSRPFYFQQPIAYGALDLPEQEANGFREVFPIADVPDVQGGKRRVNKRGGLNNFTGCAGQGIYRGDRLPADLKGNLIIPEPVGRLIRRAIVTPAKREEPSSPMPTPVLNSFAPATSTSARSGLPPRPMAP